MPGADVLKCYFDDAGTHRDSLIVVWGGVFGTQEQLDALDRDWQILLQKPLPGKPPLNLFHLAHCRAHCGEFRDYTDTECDRVQNLFRSVILNAGVMPVAFGVDVAAWDCRVTGLLRRRIGPAENLAFGSCAKAALEVTDNDGDRMLAFFDLGRCDDGLRDVYEGAGALLPEAAARLVASFVPVEGNPGLQAADVVANSFYRFALGWLDDRSARPEPHFFGLAWAKQTHWAMYGADEIDDLVCKVRQDLDF